MLGGLGCSKPPTRQDPSDKAQSAAAVSASAGSVGPSEPQARHQLAFSAYTATLAADEEAVYVLTSQAAYRFRDGQAMERWEIQLGDTPALGGSGIVYWLDGKLLRAPKQGGPGEILASVPRAPRRLAASGEHVVWEEADETMSSLRALDGAEPRTVYRGAGSVEALTLMDDQAYFVVRDRERWRLGTASLGGGAPRFAEPRTSRTPALLAPAGDVYFYDGPTSSVRRFASDLSREDVIARDVICSPLAVADRVYCAQISLLFEIPREGGATRLLAPKRAGTLTALVATRTRVAWLLDAGENRAELEVLSR